MSLTSDQLAKLKNLLLEQKEKLESVSSSLHAGDPAQNSDRLTDNADAGTDAIESSNLIEYESLENETEIILNRVKTALQQIEDGTYGKTAEGEEIPYERLLIDPTATTTVK